MIDLNRIKSQLATAKVRETDFALFQVVNQLIDVLRQSNKEIVTQITGGGSGGRSTTGLLTRTYLTTGNETGILTQSRRLLAGSGISFNDTVAGQRTVDVTISSGSKWDVLTDGDLEETELIYAAGEVIMLEIIP